MSENHRQIGSAWVREYDERIALIYPDGPVCHYLGYLPGECAGPIERHHVIELVDGGDRFTSAPACRRHHQDMTTANRQQRKPTSRLSDATRPPATPAPATGNRVLSAHLWPVVLSCFAAAGVTWTGHTAWAWTLAGLWGVHLSTLAYVLLTTHRRGQQREAIRTLTVRAVKADPRLVGVKGRSQRIVSRWGWESGLRARPLAGRVSFPAPEVMTDPATRKRVEDGFWTALRARVSWPDHALHPYFDWTVQPPTSGRVSTKAPGPTSAERAEGAAVPDPEQEKIRQVIEEDLRITMRLQKAQNLRFEITERDADGPKVYRLRYPEGFQDGEPERRYLIQERISEQLGGTRFMCEWDRRAEAKEVIGRRRPPMPSMVPFPLPPIESVRTLNPMVVGIGPDETGGIRNWNLAMQPHGIAAGGTGSGKTVFLLCLIYQLLLRGWDLIIIDGKGTPFAGLRHWPGVRYVGLGEPEEMAHAAEAAKAEMEWRYDQVKNHDKDPSDFRPLMVILDEAAEFQVNVADWWKETRERNQPTVAPALKAKSSIARKGREGEVHEVIGLQQARGDFFSSTEERDNLAFRLTLGAVSEEGARMMHGRSDFGRDVPDVKGRGTLSVLDGPAGKGKEPVEVQTYFVPRPRPSGRFDTADEAWLSDLRRLIEHVRAGQSDAPLHTSFDTAPDARLADEHLIGVDDLAARLRTQDIVAVLLDGELFKVTAVDESGDPDAADVTHVLADGRREVMSVPDDTMFELRGGKA